MRATGYETRHRTAGPKAAPPSTPDAGPMRPETVETAPSAARPARNGRHIRRSANARMRSKVQNPLETCHRITTGRSLAPTALVDGAQCSPLTRSVGGQHRSDVSTGVVALLFTDLVGSTELLTRLGDDAADDLRRVHFGLLRAQLAATGGREVKTLGDGLMAVFASPLDALPLASKSDIGGGTK